MVGGSLIRSAGLARSLPRCYLDLCIYCWQSIHYRVNSRPFCYPRSGMQIRCATCLSSQVNRRAEARVRPCSNNNNRVLSGTRLLDLIIILRVVIFLNRKYQCVSRNCAKEGAAVYLGNFIDHDNSNETSNVIGLSSIVP